MTAGGVPVTALASLVRSKNAGPFVVSLDFVFPDRATYEAVCEAGAISREAIAALYGLPPERVSEPIEYAAANAIKINIVRERPAGSVGERDLYGSQQAGILDALLVPIPEPAR